MAKIIFITGTDTGVGKTVLTGLLLSHLRSQGIRALAIKPFCSGGRSDVKFLQKIQSGELSDTEVNPFYFSEPLAPFIAARIHRKKIYLPDVLTHIDEITSRCDYLLIEGAGGLMVPLGDGFSILDLIASIRCKVILVAPNRLGTINHTILSEKALQAAGQKELVVAMVEPRHPDLSSEFNPDFLRKALYPIPVFSIPDMPRISAGRAVLKKNERILKKLLARMIL